MLTVNIVSRYRFLIFETKSPVLFKKTQEKTTLLDVSISKRGIVIQAAVIHSIEQRKDA